MIKQILSESEFLFGINEDGEKEICITSKRYDQNGNLMDYKVETFIGNDEIENAVCDGRFA